MFTIHTKEVVWGGRKLTLETGRIARQADAAVLATYGETTVLCTAVAQKTPKEGIDFFPLTVNYQEKAFAAGKIPGGFFKREGRPAEKETLASRMIDRCIRPLFAPGFRNETQVICTVSPTTSRTIPISSLWSVPRPHSPFRAFPSWAPSAVRAWVISMANTSQPDPAANGRYQARPGGCRTFRSRHDG